MWKLTTWTSDFWVQLLEVSLPSETIATPLNDVHSNKSLKRIFLHHFEMDNYTSDDSFK